MAANGLATRRSEASSGVILLGITSIACIKWTIFSNVYFSVWYGNSLFIKASLLSAFCHFWCQISDTNYNTVKVPKGIESATECLMSPYFQPHVFVYFTLIRQINSITITPLRIPVTWAEMFGKLNAEYSISNLYLYFDPIEKWFLVSIVYLFPYIVCDLATILNSTTNEWNNIRVPGQTRHRDRSHMCFDCI